MQTQPLAAKPAFTRPVDFPAGRLHAAITSAAIASDHLKDGLSRASAKAKFPGSYGSLKADDVRWCAEKARELLALCEAAERELAAVEAGRGSVVDTIQPEGAAQ